jgi:hypothetical protein
VPQRTPTDSGSGSSVAGLSAAAQIALGVSLTAVFIIVLLVVVYRRRTQVRKAIRRMSVVMAPRRKTLAERNPARRSFMPHMDVGGGVFDQSNPQLAAKLAVKRELLSLGASFRQNIAAPQTAERKSMTGHDNPMLGGGAAAALGGASTARRPSMFSSRRGSKVAGSNPALARQSPAVGRPGLTSGSEGAFPGQVLADSNFAANNPGTTTQPVPRVAKAGRASGFFSGLFRTGGAPGSSQERPKMHTNRMGRAAGRRSIVGAPPIRAGSNSRSAERRLSQADGTNPFQRNSSRHNRGQASSTPRPASAMRRGSIQRRDSAFKSSNPMRDGPSSAAPPVARVGDSLVRRGSSVQGTNPMTSVHGRQLVKQSPPKAPTKRAAPSERVDEADNTSRRNNAFDGANPLRQPSSPRVPERISESTDPETTRRGSQFAQANPMPRQT